ncbi:MAG: SGNH/GDSL hydrolase family protein [Acidobacteria bacterium]|nr:SGNH/GDSL hydrolase family protein [Acidobacteriota bacterium]
MSLISMQIRYILSGIVILPFAPFLYLQSKYVRRKVGRLPDAEGETIGKHGEHEEIINLLAIGESTVAGVGAKTHHEALTGQFAKHLSQATEKSVHWQALGTSGITIIRTLRELVPNLPAEKMDVILVALGANDVFGLSSPRKFRQNLTKLLNILREKFPDAEIFVANVPMVRDFIALPNPLRYILSRLAKLHHFNAIDLISKLDNVIYFDDVKRVERDFFSDGIHPSIKGYDLWSKAMVDFFVRNVDF